VRTQALCSSSLSVYRNLRSYAYTIRKMIELIRIVVTAKFFAVILLVHQ
jgi:hypothetical protein